MANKLPFEPLEFNFIPSVYDNNYTFLEELIELASRVNTISKYLEEFNVEVIEEYIVKEIEELKKYVDEQDNNIKIELTDYVNEKIEEVYTALNNLEILLKNYTDTQTNYVINLINSLREDLEAQIQNIIVGNILVFNPTNGKKEQLEKSLNDIYNMLRYEAITAQEFDNLELTAQNYDIKEITAQNFDLYSKTILTV